MARPASDDAGELVEQLARQDGAEVEIFDPADKAHQMRLAGKAWGEVARECGYPTTANAVAAVSAYLQRAALERASITRELALEEELARLDEQYAAFHGLAVTGRDVQAGRLLLSISKERSELLKLKQTTGEGGARTIIITAGAEMADELRQLVLGSEAVAPGPAAPGPTPPAAPPASHPE